MPRYYYICPIQALYMMKEFGIWFIVGDQGHYGYKECLPYALGHLTNHHTNGKFYVAPKYESIFKPKEGDFGTVSRAAGDLPCIFYKNRISNGWETFAGMKINKLEPVKIIMRDSKQFFHALREND